LCFEATTTADPKWRFLSLYRILENAYLSKIKQGLFNEFDGDAERAVAEAGKKLQSEINQLINLMAETGLEPEFVAFNQKFDTLLTANNRYIHALDRSAQSDQNYRADIPKKAILRFYKIRCSIAHAGTSSVIYEQLSDAGDAMKALLPDVEAIALKSLAITTR
jgi:hypothetical protein